MSKGKGKLRNQLDTDPASRKRPKHPDGWAPGYVDTGDRIEVATTLTSKPQSDVWRQLLEDEGYNPDEYHIAEPDGVQHRKWQQRPGDDYLYYFKFTAVRNHRREWDPTKLVNSITKRPPLKPKQVKGGAALVVNLADWQAGADHGGGPEPLTERINALGPKVVKRWRDLRKIGIPLDTLYVHTMGDMGEGCSDHYPQQTHTIHLDGEEQREYVIHALDMLLDTWAPLAPKIAVYAIPGNHGENRKDGKSFTTFRDNVDVGAVVNVAHAFSKNPDRYGHIQFHTPTGNELSMTYEHDGFLTGLIHGHQARRGGDIPKKMKSWWQDQQFGSQPIGDADLLVTAHYHHFRAIREGVRTHFMCPALCGSQDWWNNATGLDSPPGTLTYTIDRTGWSNLEVL